ncbi:hypothetical protein [Epilithonimonas mollis]|uniref:Tetratricopeptide repeat protein n=1 Tax=Epilithonimonas mollis TaxID=216903 RepID=A0A1M6SHH5_9FLAO|nr:hypothetical protein [Epilithonimonas mollis]SHK44224.1 hypothetical protein SAMN05444371_2467 [Epilithonimonas mollis]
MRTIRIFMLVILSMSASSLFAQGNKEIDSLIGSANMFLFKDPQKTIDIGKDILKKKTLADSYRISSYILISNGYSGLNDFQKSIEFALKANELSEQTKDIANQIRTLGLIGNQYIRIEMRDEAWQYLDKADKLSQMVSLPESKKYLIGNINLLKAFLYKRSLDCGYAIKHFNKAIAEFKKDKDNGFAKANLGQAYNQKAYCFLTINKDSAQVSFENGLADARKNGAKSLECNALIGLSDISSSQKDFKSSNETLLSALPLAKAAQQIEMETKIYRLLAENYIGLNDFENHLKYQKLFDSTQSRFVLEDVRSVNELLQKRNEFKQKSYDAGQKKYAFTLSVLLGVLILSTLILCHFLVKKSGKIDNIISKKNS